MGVVGENLVFKIKKIIIMKINKTAAKIRCQSIYLNDVIIKNEFYLFQLLVNDLIQANLKKRYYQSYK